ncbi:MAG TPA: cytochrome c oxidase subunit 3, partial [Gemmatimonadales bacterium]|nr:cytochrome c oxidase subunit 3 [Gemmatimonadales bacterium]
FAFLAIKYVEYSGLSYDWSSHAYGSITWTMSGFHAAHVMGVLLKGLVVEALAWKGHFTRERRLGVQINGLYWHFVVVVWIPLYFTLYWSPRLF